MLIPLHAKLPRVGLSLGRELWAINGEEMNLGHKLSTTLGQELWALNGKEMTLGHK